jgi:hypothetical protein
MSQQTYTKAQIIHSFSFASNSAFGKVFADETTCQKSYEKLQQFVRQVSKNVLSDVKTQQFIGTDWEPVWGPVVYSNDRNSSFAVADNTMGMYYSPSKKLFIIAIAGTNSISSFGWVKEDFHVNETAAWYDITKKGMGHISQGTATGLDILLTKMKDGDFDVVTALKNYIAKNKITNAEVAVTGHSLGGALSPALALYLSDKREVWNNGKDIQISVYASAGPTIGVNPGTSENNFIKYYTNQIEAGNIEYHAIINDLDIVPLAWNKNDIATIPQLYKEYGIEDVSFGTMSLIAVLNTQKRSGTSFGLEQYHYKQINPTVVTGAIEDDTKIIKAFKKLKPNTFITNLIIPKPLQANIVNLKNLVRFFAQAAYQHTTAYNALLDIESFMNVYNDILNVVPNHKVSTAEEMVFDLASEAIGIDLNELVAIGNLSEEDIEKFPAEE